MTSVDISFTLSINVGLGLILSSSINYRKYLNISINLDRDYNAEKLEWICKSRCASKKVILPFQILSVRFGAVVSWSP